MRNAPTSKFGPKKAILGGCVVVGVLVVMTTGALAQTQAAVVEPVAVRAAAKAAGLDSLATVPIPEPDNLQDFLNPGILGRSAAILLGKALFWDMQVGSDGQACGSCHFHAGADNRARNQLSPGLRNVNPSGVFNATRTGPGGPDFTLIPDDFPFHVLADPGQNNFNLRVVRFDTDDVASSQGVFPANFVGVTPGVPRDLGTPFVDSIFNLSTPNATSTGDNVRRVEPRNTPTFINAVFNHSNFWDGRAHNLFNGVSPLGPLDPARIWVAALDGSLSQRQVRMSDSSLASQAVGPPTSNLEMAFFNKPFPLVGRKLLSLNPLGLQRVHPRDSVLGPFSRAVIGQNGTFLSYPALIAMAFSPRYWASAQRTPDGFTLMEANFSLFFGVAVQQYESTTVADRTPLDLFLAGNDAALDQGQLQGLLTFMNRGKDAKGVSLNPPELDAVLSSLATKGLAIGKGNCASCHSGPELTKDGITSLTVAPGSRKLIEQESTPTLVGGLLAPGSKQGLLDAGFANIGVRPASEDLARGGIENGFPLSFVRQALFNPAVQRPTGADLPCTPGVDCPSKIAVDGAFKIPGLRNVELTGPYFHNGGQLTLGQVVEFYDRQGDFGDVNIENLDDEMAFIDIAETDEAPLVKFLLALTDPRVRNEMAPFDHPEIIVPAGGTASTPSSDPRLPGLSIRIPAVGAGGRPAAGLSPLENFLGISSTPVAGPNNDHFDGR
jgi:cytochrome c peroxidase